MTVGTGAYGIVNSTAPTLENVTKIANITEPTQFFINVNNIVFNGWLFFILLFVFAYILYRAGQQLIDQPILNAMYAFAVVTVVSFLLRAIQVFNDGNYWSLLTDSQTWTFALITMCLASIAWATKEK